MFSQLFSFNKFLLACFVLLLLTSSVAPSPKRTEPSRNLSWKERVALRFLTKKIEKQQKKALALPKKKKDDRKFHWANITALVCGVLVPLVLFTAPLALVFGIIGVVNSGEKQAYRGLGMGIAGIVLGALGFLIIGILLFFLIYWF